MKKYVPNCLSIARAILAFCLFIDSPAIRITAVFLAAATDFFDGFLARRWQQTSRFGTLIDPVADKLFVAIALWIFFREGALSVLEVCSFVARDVSLLLFTGWLLVLGEYRRWTIRSFMCGKITTALQFFVLAGLCLNIQFSAAVYWILTVIGACSLIELRLLLAHQSR